MSDKAYNGALKFLDIFSGVSQIEVWSENWVARKGLRFHLNSAATSDGSAQKLGNNLWNDSKSIAAKVYRTSQPNLLQMKCCV